MKTINPKVVSNSSFHYKFFSLNLIINEKGMQLSRRLFVPAIALILALIIIIGFVIIRKKSFTGSNPVKAIPVDAALICKINNLHKLVQSLTEQSKIWEELISLSSFKELTYNILLLDSLSRSNTDLEKIAQKSTSYLSGHNIGGRRNEFLFIINLHEDIGAKSIIDLFSKLTQQDIDKSERKYEGISIFTFKTSKNIEEQVFYFAIVEGNIIISQSVILIENSIRQLSLTNSLLNDPDFVEVINTTGKNKEANIYLNLNKISNFIVSFASSDFQPVLKEYKEFGGWLELDLNISPDKIIFNGFLISDHHKDLFINLFDGSKPVKLTCEKILPATVSAFVSFGVDNPDKMEESLKRYLMTIEKKNRRESRLREFEDLYDFSADDLFKTMIENEVTVAKVESENAPEKESTVVILKCKSGNQSRKQLDDIVTQVAKKKGLDPQSLRTKYTFDDQTRYDISELPVKDITGLVFGGLFSMIEKTFFTQIGNYIVFSESQETLAYIIRSNILNKTLATSEIYKNFSENIDQKSYLLFYTDLSRSSSVFSKYLDSKIIRKWEKNASAFQKIRPFGIQITSLSNKTYCNILNQYIAELKSKPQTVWESLLDTTCQFKPQLLVNHNTSENEIFLQDLNNNIYLINKAGRILWKQNLPEKINSKVFQVDYFNNGKLQIFFSSDNYIHLIDRNGNYVERFPVRLRSASSAGMSLFDYDKDKNYRILIPCIDNKVYAYSKEGTMITGWEFEGSDYPIGQPLNHFRVGDKDFIVFGDKYRTYMLDRKGKQRVSINQEILKSKNNNYIMDEAKSRILITDTTGNIISIYFDGRTDKTTIGNFSPNHFFDFKDIDADGEKDYLFLDENTVSIYKQSKAKIFTYQFKHTIQERPVYYNFSYSDRKLGFVDAEEEKIYLLNNNGNVYKGFPLEGTTMFSIGYLEATGGKFNLIVGGRNNFLYNYSVQ